MDCAQWKKTVLAVGVFSLAMGFLEAVVVVYLRLHFYPQGFSFPLATIPHDILILEVLREVSTIVMLAALAWIAARTYLSRFAVFALAFGIWDIVYYVALKAALDWPADVMTLDILFLIPLPWAGPVLAPVLVSSCLIVGGLLVLWRESCDRPVLISGLQWATMIAGGVVILVSFMLDAGAVMEQQEPGAFAWPVFLAGLVLGLVGFISALRKR